MQKARQGLIAVSLLLCMASAATADVTMSVGMPNLSIGINLPLFPHLVPVPGYPVYYAPEVEANYFFYDGMYWIYHDDSWYASSWYNGPWEVVSPDYVPLFILRIPVRYYRLPPVYFHGWQVNAPPRWGQHWGRDWEQRRRGWDKWKRGAAPPPAPLPVYQRQYSGDRYPHGEQQKPLRNQHYRYQPRDKAVRQQLQHQDRQQAMPRHQVGPSESRPQSPQQNPAQQRGPSFRDRRQPPEATQPPERRELRGQDREERIRDRREQQEPRQGQGQGQRRDEDRRPGR